MKNNQKAFISIPVLVAIIAGVVATATVATGIVLYKTGKISLNNQRATVSESLIQETESDENQEEEVVQVDNKDKVQEEIGDEGKDNQSESEQTDPETDEELEKARMEAERARQEAEKAKQETARAKAEAERLKTEQQLREVSEIADRKKESIADGSLEIEAYNKRGVTIKNKTDETVVLNELKFTQGQEQSWVRFNIRFPDSADSKKLYYLGGTRVSNRYIADIGVSCKRNYDGKLPDKCERYYEDYNPMAGEQVNFMMDVAINEIRPGETAKIIADAYVLGFYYIKGGITGQSTGEDIYFDDVKGISKMADLTD